MKNIFNNYKSRLSAFLLFFIVASLSCERPWVEPWPPDGARAPSDIWDNYLFAKGFLEKAYADQMISSNIMDVQGYGMLASATDEAEHSDQQGIVQIFTNGVWNPTYVPETFFGGLYLGQYSNTSQRRVPYDNSYIGIRRANIFLENVEKSAIIDDVSLPSRRYERTFYIGSAYFLRAYLEFELFKRYGAFNISTKSQTLDENLFLPRNTYQECYDQIIKDCDSAIIHLPYLFDDNNWHRPTKTVTQTLKATVSLYWASPLFQGDPATQPYGIAANTVGDVNRWLKTIEFARAAIQENAFYTLMPVTTFVRPFSGTGTYNSQLNLVTLPNQTESIWSANQSAQNSGNNEMFNLPDGVEGCMGYTNPTQEMVDAFEVVPLASGKPVAGQPAVPFDWTNPIHAANPYANRDPRFYSSINYNGVLWGTNVSYQFYVDTYEGGVHRNPTRPNSTKTGYYFRKFLSETYHKNVSGLVPSITRFRNRFSFAELLMIYAEAMNEAWGPDGVDPDGALRISVSTAREAVNLIRARVSMPPIPAVLTQDQMRTIIKHERQVEFCFEGYRFFDLRRWKEGEKLGAPIHGIKITPASIDPVTRRPVLPYTYQVIKVEDRVWSDKMYRFPIPYSEIVKSGGVLKQNPGW